MTRLLSLLAALVLTSSAVTASPIIPLFTGGTDLINASILGDPTTSIADSLDVASDLLSASPPQVLPSSSVLVGSTTNVVPVTGVYPHLQYQPSIELNGPIVQDYTPLSPYFGNGYSTYGLGSLGLGSGPGRYKRQMGGSPLGSGPGSAPLGPTIGGGFGGAGGPIGGGRGPMGGGPLVGPTSNFAGAPSGTVTDTLIKPLVSITPHALEPVPYPVSTFYDYPVPVGVPAPVPTPVATGFGGKFGFDDFGCSGRFGCDDFGFGGFDRFGFDGFGFDGFGFDDFDNFDF
ncbi:hypothetical protein BG003_011007 [Podila horticola]|nr:hypothetical protein BG003_011007 [Podila horticola]